GRGSQRRTAGARQPGPSRLGRDEKSESLVSRPARSQAAAVVSLWPSRPIGEDAHSGPQFIDLLDRIGAYRKGPQIEIAGRAGRPPAGIFSLWRYDANFRFDCAPAQGRDAH